MKPLTLALAASIALAIPTERATQGLRIRCMGRIPNIIGTSNGETLIGTPANDVIRAFSGHDTILGGDGNDRICANGGWDVIHGGKGFDRARGNKGRDRCVSVERRWSCKRR